MADDQSTRFKNLDSASVDARRRILPRLCQRISRGYRLADPRSRNLAASATGGEGVNNTEKATDNHQISGTLTKIKGNHDLKFGGGYYYSVFASPNSSQTSDSSRANQRRKGHRRNGLLAGVFSDKRP